MIDFFKGATCVVVLSSLAGCGALDPVNMILAARASSYDMAAELTSPEMRNITLTSLRPSDCDMLTGILPLYQNDLTKGTAKGDRADIAVAEMNISVVKQIQREKSCPVTQPLQAKNPASAATPTVAPTSSLSSSPAFKTAQGSLDITIDSVSPSMAKSLGMADQKGALVVDAKKGSAADKAGIKPLDVILEVNGQPVSTPAEFDNIVSRMRPGYKAPLRVFRAGKTRNVSVVVSKDERPAPVAVAEPDTAPSMASPLLATHGWMGMQYVMSALGLFEDIPPSVATSLGLSRPQGVLIGGALPGGAADKAGLRTLDVIVSLNGRQIENKKQLTDLLARLPGGAPIKLGIWRNRKLESAQVILDSQTSQLPLPPTAGGYCFAWINANAATKTGVISYEFVVSTADAAEDINPAIGAQFRAYMIERGLGADFGGTAGYAVCRKTREAIIKAREDATTALKQSFTATGKDTLAVYWVPR
jgi:membrane-associated protease RseP (regulator of RpoE activity)